VAATPRRLSAWVNLALVEDARGQPERARAHFEAIEDAAPALLSDARREAGRGADRVALLERCLTMMRGNRSSSTITYFSGGELRLVPNRAGSAAEVHAHDVRELGQMLQRLRRGL